MGEEEFLLLDDDEDELIISPNDKSITDKVVKNTPAEILSNISKTVGDSISQIPLKMKESSDLKKSVKEKNDNIISFAKSADKILDADLVVDGTYNIEWGIGYFICTFRK